MKLFTANQVNQVFVLKSTSNVVATLDASHQITKSSSLGSIGLGKTPDNKSIYFKHLGAGGITRSDLIDIANIQYIKATPASKMARPLAAAAITLNSAVLDSSNPLVGKDYILKIKFQNPIGMSPDNQYWKYGVVHSVTGMDASTFYKTLALSIVGNMAREAVKLISVELTTNSTSVEVTDTKQTLNGSYTGVVIKEVAQDWILGVKQDKPLIFTVEADTVSTTSGEAVWADVVYNTGKKTVGGVTPSITTASSGLPTGGTIVNSKTMADYEYFYMGERGDQYRLVNWPNYVPTTYLVDPTHVYGYDTIAIHYSYTGANHSVQKSEKDITFIIPRAETDSTASSVGALAGSLLSAINAVVNPVDTRYATKEELAKITPAANNG